MKFKKQNGWFESNRIKIVHQTEIVVVLLFFFWCLGFYTNRIKSNQLDRSISVSTRNENKNIGIKRGQMIPTDQSTNRPEIYVCTECSWKFENSLSIYLSSRNFIHFGFLVWKKGNSGTKNQKKNTQQHPKQAKQSKEMIMIHHEVSRRQRQSSTTTIKDCVFGLLTFCCFFSSKFHYIMIIIMFSTENTDWLTDWLNDWMTHWTIPEKQQKKRIRKKTLTE